MLRIALLAILNLSVASTSFSQSKPVIRMGATNTQSFDDNWAFTRYGLQADGSRIEEPQNLESTTLNESSWQKLNLPHDFGITGPFGIELEGGTGKLPWKGIGWYRKHFKIPAADAGKRIFVDFDGAMANAKIWLNGHYVGTWPYGYNSFRMDLTPYLLMGKENVLAVRLDTENWDSRWYPGAGIYRHVWLVKTNPVHVGHWGTSITTPEITDASAKVKMDITVENQSKLPVEATVQTAIFELDQQNKPETKITSFNTSTIKIDAGAAATTNTQATIQHPKRWDIVAPNRYIAQTTLSINGKVVDTYQTPFGIRTLKFTARDGFQLNGRRVEIQGTCNHHDLGALGAAINTSALRRQLSILKDMGCNALRTSHNPPSPELLELADQMGFLVWDEAFDCWKSGKRKLDYNKIYEEWHQKDLEAMVHRDRNHPSVFIWSIGNEVMEQRNVEMTKHLADIIRKVDPTRPVSNGYNDPDGGRESGAVEALDIMGVNYFFSQQAKWDADPRYKSKPTLGSETSSCVSSRGEYFFDNQYKNWQISSYDDAFPGWGCSPDEQFRTNAKYPHLLGEFVWTGFDYLGEPTPYNSDATNLQNFRNDPAKRKELELKLEELRKKNPPSRSSYFGIVDLAGFPKDRYYLYQSQWRPDCPMAHILPHWNWAERIGQVTPVHVYTSGDEAELFLNGKSLGRKTKTPGKDFRLVWDDVKYTPGELKVVCYKKGKTWATDIVKTTGKASKITLSANQPVIKAGGDDLSYITVKITDKNGLMVPRTHNSIKFSVQGPGEIVATDNGDATSFIPFQSHERPAYNGMALVIVKGKKGQKGKFSVKAESPGLGSAVISLESK
ncbi:beta-galactosidase GalB [Pedobacter sp.]|uniref:beta-galactosidase GalB n=1 Tax=Pedobacter sp. TaxID=1411316 RepID=UPI002C35EB07|nr:beta-galactosidase GalB [Pedobacter sp.]HWW42887.1 beta-galactosidase GalB [Pedobacter sp.]